MPVLPELSLSPGDILHGFKVLAATPLPDLFLVAYELEHLRSGARMIHLHAEDAENLFSVHFPTPPQDDTGLPHILEHAVLAGSRRFPVRDPFFEMYKMSMATFINAMTGKDCTYYPVCSNVRADLFNLAEVYFDAVFHPLLTEETFQREGHHACPADPEKPTGALSVNGIVYNEMKAAYARPESRLWRDMCRTLLPDTCYGRDSGGDPDVIPSLSYRQFLEFHRVHYHPSNAHFICYGDIETQAFLEFLNPRLEAFERLQNPVRLSPQPPWTVPKELTSCYDPGEESAASRTYLQMSWRVPAGLDAETIVLLNVLGLVLFGDDAAPLKRALIDSGLGQDLVMDGLLLASAEGIFGVGLKGSEPERMDAFRELVLDTLRKLCEQGIEPALVESAFQQYSYQVREISELRPLRVAQDVVTPWILGGDPLLYLRLGSLLEGCRKRCLLEDSVLTGLIRAHLLDNPHRLDQRLVPDPDWRRKSEEAFTQRMACLRATMSDAGAEALAKRAGELQRQAGVANSAEALATLPQLSKSDLPPLPSRIPTEVEQLADGTDFLRNDVFSNGVNYLALYVDLEGLETELWPFLPFYVETVQRMGASGQDFAEIARRTSAVSGGISCRTQFVPHRDDPGRTCKGLVFRVKALDEQIGPALEVLSDKLLAPDPRDRERLRDVVAQLLSEGQTQLVSAGHRTALTQLMAGMTEAGYLAELCGGRSLYRALKRLTTGFETAAEETIEAVLRIHAAVRRRGRLTASFTGCDAAAGIARKAVERISAASLPGPASPSSTGFRPFHGVPRIGLTGPLQVAHCAQVMPAPHMSHPEAPWLSLGMSMLRVDYMISELRFKGNAYGASCSYGNGILSLSTYADPHIRRTLEVFSALPQYVRDVPWTDVELTRGILSTAKGFVTPIRPESATSEALVDHVSGLRYETMVERYETLRSATPDRVKQALLSVLEPGFKVAPVAVVASREKLEAENRELGDRALALEPLLD